MDKLSERLWVMRVSLENLTEDELATFDEAIEQAKRYEDAPVAHMCGECEHTWMRHVDTDTPEQDAALAGMTGKRVRIVEDGA